MTRIPCIYHPIRRKSKWNSTKADVYVCLCIFTTLKERYQVIRSVIALGNYYEEWKRRTVMGSKRKQQTFGKEPGYIGSPYIR